MSKKSTIDTALPFAFSFDALKSGFEKSLSAFDGAETAAKDNLEAGIESATIAAQGLQALNNEALSFARQSAEDAITVTRNVFGARSPLEAFQIQADFAKTSYFGALRQAARFSELATGTARDSFAPLQSRAEAFAKTASV